MPPANTCRTISTVSRMRASGRLNETPCRPSITCGPEAPSPSRNRPPDRLDSVIAVWATTTGERVPTCNDAGTEQHPLGPGSEVAQRRRRVRTPRLGDPTDVQAQLLGLDAELNDLAHGAGQLDRRGGAHQRTPCSASLLIAARVLPIAASNSRIRTNTIFCSLSGIESIATDNPERPGPICIQ